MAVSTAGVPLQTSIARKEADQSPSVIAKQFGGALARERKRANLSQEELGRRAQVHRTEVSQLERGLRVPRIDTLIKLAGSLDIKPETLLDGLKWKPSLQIDGEFI